MAVGDNAPVIIKRKKVIAGDGHHGGAWKVAYADFVTAMMAFFLLMWLLNATTEQQRKGLADYFAPSIPLARVSGGGDGAFGADSVMSEEIAAQIGRGASALNPTEQRQAKGESGETGETPAQKADDPLEEAEEIILAAGGESAQIDNALRHVITRLTDEGLVIEIFDLEDAPLFEDGGATPGPVLETLAYLIAGAFQIVSNGVAVEGHTASFPRALANDPSWDLSGARADAFRVLLEGAGHDPARISRMTGHADRQRAARNPMAVRNNRLEVILLRSDL